MDRVSDRELVVAVLLLFFGGGLFFFGPGIVWKTIGVWVAVVPAIVVVVNAARSERRRARQPVESAESVRNIEDLRAQAGELGLALVLLRHDEPNGDVMLEPLFLGTETQKDGMTALRMLDADDLRIELIAYEEDVRRVLNEPNNPPRAS
jgi:hypothetical protein